MWLYLTSSTSGNRVLVNMTLVRFVRHRRSGSQLEFDDDTIDVRETQEQIAELVGARP